MNVRGFEIGFFQGVDLSHERALSTEEFEIISFRLDGFESQAGESTHIRGLKNVPAPAKRMLLNRLLDDVDKVFPGSYVISVRNSSID